MTERKKDDRSIREGMHNWQGQAGWVGFLFPPSPIKTGMQTNEFAPQRAFCTKKELFRATIANTPTIANSSVCRL